MTGCVMENEAFINELGEGICRRGLRVPALIALEAGRPLAFLGGQLLWLAQPVASLFIAPAQVAKLAYVLEEPSALQALVAQLEAREG